MDLAGKTIKPSQQITTLADRIAYKNIHQRIAFGFSYLAHLKVIYLLSVIIFRKIPEIRGFNTG